MSMGGYLAFLVQIVSQKRISDYLQPQMIVVGLQHRNSPDTYSADARKSQRPSIYYGFPTS
jgi:hypothetical protein